MHQRKCQSALPAPAAAAPATAAKRVLKEIEFLGHIYQIPDGVDAIQYATACHKMRLEEVEKRRLLELQEEEKRQRDERERRRLELDEKKILAETEDIEKRYEVYRKDVEERRSMIHDHLSRARYISNVNAYYAFEHLETMLCGTDRVPYVPANQLKYLLPNSLQSVEKAYEKYTEVVPVQDRFRVKEMRAVPLGAIEEVVYGAIREIAKDEPRCRKFEDQVRESYEEYMLQAPVAPDSPDVSRWKDLQNRFPAPVNIDDPSLVSKLVHGKVQLKDLARLYARLECIADRLEENGKYVTDHETIVAEVGGLLSASCVKMLLESIRHPKTHVTIADALKELLSEMRKVNIVQVETSTFAAVGVALRKTLEAIVRRLFQRKCIKVSFSIDRASLYEMITQADSHKLATIDQIRHLDALRVRLNTAAHNGAPFDQVEAKCAWSDLMCVLHWDQGKFLQ
jgi:hypothetical protein